MSQTLNLDVRTWLLEELELGLAHFEGPDFCKAGFRDGINISSSLFTLEDFEKELFVRQAELKQIIHERPESPAYFRHSCATGQIELVYEVIKAADCLFNPASREEINLTALDVAERLIFSNWADELE